MYLDRKVVGWAFAAVLATGLMGAANAATVNDVIDFNDGSSSGGAIKTYVEDGYQFYDARIVGGPCEFPGADKCAALNKHEVTVLTREDGLAFDLTSIWFYLNGKAEDLSNALAIYDTNDSSHRFDLTQALYVHNVGHTVALDFLNVFSITFASGGDILNCADDKKGKAPGGDKPCKDQGNARFDTAKVSQTTGVVPLPAGGFLLVSGLGALAAVRRKRKAA